MAVTIDIEKIARLSKLKIEPERAPMFTAQMEAIIGMVEHLPESEGAWSGMDESAPMALREDVIKPSLRREEILKNAPETQAGCVVVPKTVE